jgi:hypothetical protein
MIYLRQSTASQSVLVGPFVDSTDGVTAETGLTIANTDIRLSANGGNMVAKNSGGGTHDEIGYYTITLDATDTATVGRLQLCINATGALPVYHEFIVLEEAVYDNLFAASAPGPLAANNNGSGLTEAGGDGDHLTAINLPNQTMDITGNLSGSVGSVTGNVGGIAGTITTLDALDTAQDTQHAQTQSDIAGLNDIAATDIVSGGAITTSGGVANANIEQISGSSVTESSSGRIAGNFNTFFDNADSASAQTQDDVGGGSSLTVADIADGVWDELQSGHVGAGTFGEIATEIASILVDTNELQTDDIPGAIAALNDPTVAEIRSEIDSNSTQLAAIISAQTTAQNDLDIVTGVDGVTLATLQGNYAPAKAGDEMDFVDAPNSTAVTAIQGDGSAFTSIPWNAAWDAEVQSEAQDAITASFTFSNGNVSANIEEINTVTITGNGSTGTEFSI